MQKLYERSSIIFLKNMNIELFQIYLRQYRHPNLQGPLRKKLPGNHPWK